MLSAKYALLTVSLMLIIMAGSAIAQWSPGGMIAYVGDLNLLASSGSQAAESTLNNSSINATLINGTAIDNSTMAINALAAPSQAQAPSSGKEVLDLSSYSRDRVNKSLAGYKNIMYPISGSRGTTTSTAGGGGGGCGCG